jgi:hypothetical protein
VITFVSNTYFHAYSSLIWHRHSAPGLSLHKARPRDDLALPIAPERPPPPPVWRPTVALDAFAPTASTNPEDDVVTAAAPVARLKKKKSMAAAAAAAPEVAAEPPVVRRGEFCSITAMPAHEHLSFEELRVRQMQVRFAKIFREDFLFIAPKALLFNLYLMNAPPPTPVVPVSHQALPDLVTAHLGSSRSAHPALPRFLSYLFEERAANRARAEENRAHAEAALVAEVEAALCATLDDIESIFAAEERAAEEARELQRVADAAAAAAAAAEEERRREWNPKAFFQQKCKAGATSGIARQNSMLMEKAKVCTEIVSEPCLIVLERLMML